MAFPTNPSQNQPYWFNGRQYRYNNGVWERNRAAYFHTKVFESVNSVGRLRQYEINIPNGVWLGDGGLAVHTVDWSNRIDLNGTYAYYDLDFLNQGGQVVGNSRHTYLIPDEIADPSNPSKGFAQVITPINAYIYRVNIKLIYKFNQVQSGDWVDMFLETVLEFNIQ